jgi:non-specific serine/threonine protein kinase
MPPLTAQGLRNNRVIRQVHPNILQRGRDYYNKGRVIEVDLLDDNTAVCQVSGNTGSYEVEIESESRDGLTFDCNCPYAADGNICKHMVAAALELADYLEANSVEKPIARPAPNTPVGQPKRAWQNKLDMMLGPEPRRPSAYKPSRTIGVVILERADYYGYSYGTPGPGNAAYMLTPFAIPVQEWSALPGAAPNADREAIHKQLETDRQWIRMGREISTGFDPAAFLNLDRQAVGFLHVLATFKRMYYSPSPGNMPMLLSMLSKLDLPVFKGSTRSAKIEQRLHVLPDPIEITIDLLNSGETLKLVLGLERDGQFSPIEGRVTVLSQFPPWILLDNMVAQLQTTQVIDQIGSFPMQIPAADAEHFRERYLARLAQTLPFRTGVIQWRDVQVEPAPRLYLRDDSGSGLLAELRFGYGEHELSAVKSGDPVTVVNIPETWEMVRIHRNREREDLYLQDLASANFGLKRADWPEPYGTLALRARVHPYDFLLRCVPLLAQAGCEIYGEESLKIGKINRSTPTLRVTITSGIDWFDLKAVVEFGDQQISLQAVRKALQRGERFVKLADGSAGQIPEAFLEKYRHLWKLATETEAGFRVSNAHLPLMDTLLEDDPDIRVPPDLLERRRRLRTFEQITPQPVAQNFIGDLRPYQKHGVDWLHFLREYKFGGILADDMGLGKTIQVLAFLQSLKERLGSSGRPSTLLVVPKSLVANWQREAAKFTPDLRFLRYQGKDRDKDPALFDAFDIVLTTYGIMLRDIDSLRGYRFETVILDESQAIKNPLAKSAKAARLLEADHRLVLTGTPVENNTLDLWSQFAFLNPGLLGSLDFFRHEFATPIESRGDAAAAATLRKLAYPFILRRTKEQVAPELPARTERIIYTDMDSAQKKLYDRTRDRYRAELLGLIESEGLNQTRFKILEGLLRLRQIALHPRLVDSSYRADAPKVEMLLETLETLKAENHKALIFSQFVGMLKLVKRELDERGLRYVYLDGQTANRQERVDQFQTDPDYPFFLISLKAGGVGLNLTAADYVIHLDPWWNPAVEMQASDRAHRIGQDKPVFIYKIIARDTVEEKILTLQEKKRTLVKSLVTTEAGFFKSLTRDDVGVLFG